MVDPDKERCLRPTPVIDSDHPSIRKLAAAAVADAGPDPADRATRLYYAVRDPVWYTPYYPFYRPEHYRASAVLESGCGYCVSKAALLCALGRAAGIPSRLGFADVRNHLATRELIAWLGSDLFVYHGYTEFFVHGRWVQATPAFNTELCARHGVAPLEFDGRRNSVFQPFDLRERRYMEYVNYHGTREDVPVPEILAAWREAYGEQRVNGWIRDFDSGQIRPGRRFYRETVWSGSPTAP